MDSDVLKWALGTLLAIVGTAAPFFARMRGVETRVAQLETKVDLFWKSVADRAASLLHSPHTPVLDRLLERYQRQEISTDELQRLIVMLRDIEVDATIDSGLRFAASVMLSAIEQRYEL